MVEINILTDFSFTPGARDYEDGKESGLEFYEKLLKMKFEEALSQEVKLKVNLDGVEGYPSSFLSESFGLLGNEFGAENVWKNLIIVSNEVPKYIKKIEGYVFEKRE
ncbi:STAS-like domain-containing protein [uncultured Zobellia sp.]|uniref:STAS-like domain-containing protein n=1 Tax=uncultured Zobellia sp. TaxID=255433 RepID=UPI0025990FDF|nr:STAS-like domain-containing protein [uncultured Zobellia sp.]